MGPIYRILFKIKDMATSKVKTNFYPVALVAKVANLINFLSDEFDFLISKSSSLFSTKLPYFGYIMQIEISLIFINFFLISPALINLLDYYVE